MNTYKLTTRVSLKNAFDTLTKAQRFDLVLRKTALIPIQKAANRIVNYCKPEDNVVSVGIGTGILPIYIGGKMKHLEIYGIEENPNLFEVAKDNLNLCFWAGCDFEVEFENAGFTKLPFDDGVADIVYSYNSMHLWTHPIQVIKECIRICKHGGTIYIEDFNRNVDDSYITFILPFIKDGSQSFLESIRSGYIKEELAKMLKITNTEWDIVEDDLSLILTTQKK